MNNSNMKKFPDEFNNIPFLGYFNHNINSIIPNKYINKQLINKKYTNNIFINNPYIGYINHSIPFTSIYNKNIDIDKEIKCDLDYSEMINYVIKKYQLCEDIKTKKMKDIGIQCNFEDEDDDFEVIENNSIPYASFLNVGNYLFNKSHT